MKYESIYEDDRDYHSMMNAYARAQVERRETMKPRKVVKLYDGLIIHYIERCDEFSCCGRDSNGDMRYFGVRDIVSERELTH